MDFVVTIVHFDILVLCILFVVYLIFFGFNDIEYIWKQWFPFYFNGLIGKDDKIQKEDS